MKTRLLSIFCLIGIVLPVMAAERTPEQALSCAQRFFSEQVSSPQKRTSASPRLRILKTYTLTSSSQPAFYTFLRGENEGYVLISADDRVPAVLGYAESGGLDTIALPDNMQAWMENYQRELTWLNSHPECEAARSVTLASSVSPLLGDITWSQGKPYNNLCPVLTDDKRCITGCVATATAQVMMYYQHPVQGAGSHSYTSSTHQYSLSANFGNTTYQWSQMLDSYDAAYTETQANAVATLLSHVGIACDMDYGQSSGAQTGLVGYALKTYFGYDPSIQLCSRDHYAGDWEQLIRKELDASRPVIYDGVNEKAGHCFVCDGYNSQGYFHINWGWGGTSNGYYLLTVLAPGSQGFGGSSGGYSFGQGALINVQPDAGGASPQVAKFTYDDLTVDKTSWGRFESVTFTATHLMNSSVDVLNTGDLSLLIMQDYQIKDKIDLSGSATSLKQGYYFYSQKFSGTTILLADGTYDVALGYKPSGYSKWQLVCGRGGVPYYYTLVAEDGTRTLTPRMKNQSEPYFFSFFTTNPLLETSTAVLNASLMVFPLYHDFRDTVRLALENVNTHQQVNISSATYVDIAAGEYDTLSVFVFELPEAGDYQPFIRYGNQLTSYYWDTIHINSLEPYRPHNAQFIQQDSTLTVSWQSLCDTFEIWIMGDDVDTEVYNVRGHSLQIPALKAGDYLCWITGYYPDPVVPDFFRSIDGGDFYFTIPEKREWCYIVAQRSSKENFYFLTPDKMSSKSRLVAVNAKCSVRTQIDTIATSSSYLWMVEQVGDSVLLKNKGGQYVSCASAKTAAMSDAGTKLLLTTNSDGTYTFTYPSGTDTHYLSLATAGNDYYVFYANANQTTHLYLLPQGQSSPTSVESHPSSISNLQSKILIGNSLYILRDGKTYNAQGAEMR